MKDYSTMSDLDINIEVAVNHGFDREKCELGWSGKSDVGVEWSERTGYPIRSFNYCNNPADSWPIIKQAEISILKDSGLHLWCAAPSTYWADGSEWQISGEVMDANPLRAAMIVYLMMKDAEKCDG